MQAQARLAQAQANHVKTDLDVKKYRPLAEQKAVTQQDLDNALQANTGGKGASRCGESRRRNSASAD